MHLKNNERIVCPAIWIDDKEKHPNQPENISSGYVVFGLHLVDIFYRISRRGADRPIDIKNTRTYTLHEGYFTNQNRFLKGWIDR
ncbi:MAG: hypothetical protein JXB34_12790 [Bacteroidales bacterium]|nr:hypothetical protein [Bacteroidales bacterium]